MGLSNVIKALGGLKSPSKPEIQALAREASAIASSRIHEFKLLEMSNLLYGLSLMQHNDPAIYQLCVQQSIRILEQRHVDLSSHQPSGLLRGEEGWIVRNQSWNDRAPVDFSPSQLQANESDEGPLTSPSSLYRPRAFDHKTINSIVASCVSAGIIPSDLVEVAEMKGLRVRNPSSYHKVRKGHPHFSSSRWAAAKKVPGSSSVPPSPPRANGEAIHLGEGMAGGPRGMSRGMGSSRSHHSIKPDDQAFSPMGLVDIGQLNGAVLKVHIMPPQTHATAAAAAAPSD